MVHQREGDVARTYDGREAWVMLPLTVVGQYPLNASALEGAKLDAQLAFPGGLKQFFTNWRVSYPSVVDGTPVYVIQGTSANGLVATFYFDKQTGLLTRMVRYAASAVGRVPTQIDYSDYRPVNGVMMSVQMDLRLDQRPRGIYADRGAAERPGGRSEVRQARSTNQVGQVVNLRPIVNRPKYSEAEWRSAYRSRSARPP